MTTSVGGVRSKTYGPEAARTLFDIDIATAEL
jgi:hypothetical protein